MADLDDILEALVDVEEITEELFEPLELLEDIVEEPLKIVSALLVGAGVLVTLLLLLVTLLVVLFFRTGLVFVLLGLTVLAGLLTALVVAVFLSVRTDVPHRVQRKINRIRSSESPQSPQSGGMTEEEAIDRLRDEYAEQHITIEQFEAGLEEIMAREDPKTVVREYEHAERER